MATSRDDFVIAIRSAFLKKGTRQKFSLFTLLIISVFVLSLEYFKSLEADLAIVVAYGQIIPKEILSLTKKNFINIHASLLPKWRGAAPIQRSIMNLDKQTGISVMKLEEKLDTGPICNSYSLNILENENSESLSERLSLLAAEKIIDDIDAILEDKAVFKSQDDTKAT